MQMLCPHDLKHSDLSQSVYPFPFWYFTLSLWTAHSLSLSLPVCISVCDVSLATQFWHFTLQGFTYCAASSLSISLFYSYFLFFSGQFSELEISVELEQYCQSTNTVFYFKSHSLLVYFGVYFGSPKAHQAFKRRGQEVLSSSLTEDISLFLLLFVFLGWLPA